MSTTSMPQPPSVHPVIRARRLELVDEHGEIKITLDAQESGSVIRLWGKDGKIKGSLGLLTTDQPSLMFWDGYLPKVNLRLDDKGEPALTLVDNKVMDLCEVFIESAKARARQEKRKAKKKAA